MRPASSIFLRSNYGWRGQNSELIVRIWSQITLIVTWNGKSLPLVSLHGSGSFPGAPRGTQEPTFLLLQCPSLSVLKSMVPRVRTIWFLSWLCHLLAVGPRRIISHHWPLVSPSTQGEATPHRDGIKIKKDHVCSSWLYSFTYCKVSF